MGKKDACKDSNWKTKTDMVNCVEEISFHCIGMYPKPSPACSIHNEYVYISCIYLLYSPVRFSNQSKIDGFMK